MSLQLWLPMTKDLTQQGLQTVSATNVGATLNNNGKLGKCYSFNGNGNYLLFNYGLPKTVNTWSYCCWAKLVNNSTTMCLYSQRTTTTDNQRTIFIVQGKVFYFDDGVRIQGSLNTSADLTQWNHYAFIRNNNSLKIYINGIETVSTTISSTPATVGSYTMIGASQSANTTPSGNSLYGYLNDIRLYDHALSPKEIENLSRGLVCHYPLSDSAIEATTNLVTSLTAGIRTTKSADGTSIITNGENADTYFYINTSEAITTNTIYTFSCYITGASGDSKYAYKINNESSLAFYLKNGYNEYTFSATSSMNNKTQILIDDGTRPETVTSITITNIQLEKKDHATLYAGLGGTRSGDLTVYDCSGYQYNGTANKAMTVSDNTARYSKCTIFDGNTDSIQIPFCEMLGLTSAAKTDYTVSVWTYKTSIGTKGYQTILGGTSGFELEARNGSGSDPQYVGWNWGKPVGAYEFNKWCMFTFVHTTTDCKIYVNGEYASTGSSANIPIGNYFIGSWNVYNSQNYEGKMSDFRIYATALSADDIKELYNTVASIANNGTLLTRGEFVESTVSSPQITKTGLVNTEEIVESETTTSFSKTDIKSNEFIEI